MLSPCPPTFTCVCSQVDESDRHWVEPITTLGDALVVFETLKKLLVSWPRITIIEDRENYIHAVCRTRLGFADDLEFYVCRADQLIHVRSASRFGIWDFGENRRRIEAIRRQLQVA